MSEELSVGVRILLERSKTNPDELKEEYGQWGQLREAVFTYKEGNVRGPWLRGLTEQEIDALYEMFNSLYRSVFDAWVMKTVLGGEEEELTASQSGLRFKATERYSHGWNDPRLYQNAIQPTPVQQPYQSSTTSPGLLARGKKALGIK